MSTERSIRTILPHAFPACVDCGFVKRTIEVGLSRFPQAEAMIVRCHRSRSGSSDQIKPGVFVELRGRTINLTPDVTNGDQLEERLEGYIPCCQADIANAPDKFPHHPQLEQVVKDIHGRNFRYIVPKSSPEK